MKGWLRRDDAGEINELASRDPEVDGELQITKVPFEELVKRLPNTQQVSNVNLWVRESSQLTG